MHNEDQTTILRLLHLLYRKQYYPAVMVQETAARCTFRVALGIDEL